MFVGLKRLAVCTYINVHLCVCEYGNWHMRGRSGSSK